jgi:hypothetical protein
VDVDGIVLDGGHAARLARWHSPALPNERASSRSADLRRVDWIRHELLSTQHPQP